MAPVSSSRTKTGFAKGKPTTKSLGVAKSKSKVSQKPKAPPPVQQKTKSKSGSVKKKRKVYTDKELGLPKLNMVVPVGIDVPKGKKKGKVFVDDQESMMTVLAIVNASKEGQIESKMLKSRHLEEIREARRKETEARQNERKLKLEETKDSIRRKRKRNHEPDATLSTDRVAQSTSSAKPHKKRVAFAK